MNTNQHLERLLDELRRHGQECEWIEFKVDAAIPKEIGEYLSALSNSALLAEEPYGYLVFGVEDKTLDIVGTDFRFSSAKTGNEEIENWLATQLDPQIDFRAFEFDHGDKHVVILRVDVTRTRPVSFKGIEYIRIGSYKKPLKAHPEKEKAIWDKVSRKTFETGVARAHLDGEEVLALLDFTKYFDLTSQPLPGNREGIIRKLAEESLIDKPTDGSLTLKNLGAILFAKNLRDIDTLARKVVRVIIYKGNDRLRTIKEHEFTKGYAASFEELVGYVNDQLPVNEEIGQALRKNVKVYPEIAIRELIANMLIHQDFDIGGTGPMVEIFSDRIEISNPGLPLIDPLRFIDHNPRSRNEKLAYFLRRIKVCEERGSGIDKVISAVELFQLPAPKFVAEDAFFKVTIFSPKTLRQMNREDKVRACYQHCCLRYVANELMTNESLRNRFQIKEKNYSIASRIISDTVDATLIKSSDPGNRSKKMASYVPFWA